MTQHQTTQQQTTAIETMTRKDAIQKASDSINMAIRECGIVAVSQEPPLMQAIRMAHGIKMIRGALTEQFLKENFMPLQGSALGFITDKDATGGYDWAVVRDVLCEALLRGFQPVNNEFNIIAGRFYGAKNGFERIVRMYPGVRDLRITLGVPHLVADKGALVPCEARWICQGREDSLICAPGKDGEIDTRIPVKVNSGMGPDAILGKATRKLYARIYQRLTGCGNDVVENDADVVPVESLPAPAPPEQDGKRIKMQGNSKQQKQDELNIDPMTGVVLDPERAAIQGEG